ncbi:hypothetical protein V3C99_015035 [Haemonchus contortus]
MVNEIVDTENTTRYLFRPMRAPLNRHLDDLVEEEVRAVSSSHYLREFKRTVSSAALVRLTEEPIPPTTRNYDCISISGDSSAWFFRNPCSDKRLSKNSILSAISFNADTHSGRDDATSVGHARRPRTSLHTKAIAMERPRRRICMCGNVVSFTKNSFNITGY